MTSSVLLIVLGQLLILGILLAILLRRRLVLQKLLRDHAPDDLLAHWNLQVLTADAVDGHHIRQLRSARPGVLLQNMDGFRLVMQAADGSVQDQLLDQARLGSLSLEDLLYGARVLPALSLGEGEQRQWLILQDVHTLDARRTASMSLLQRLQPDREPTVIQRSAFAMEKNSAARLVVAALGLLWGYALIDGIFINKNQLLNYTPLLWLALPALLAGWLSRRYLAHASVPQAETRSLSVLLAISVVLAGVPLAKRVDAWAAGSARPLQFQLQADATLVPLQAGIPVIDQGHQYHFWQQFEPGSTHQLHLIHGPLGLWQLDMSPLESRLQEFERSYAP